MDFDSLYGELLGGPVAGPAPAPGQKGKAKAVVETVDSGRFEDDIFGAPAKKDAPAASAKVEVVLTSEPEEQAPAKEELAKGKVPQTFSAAKLMMPPVRKKADDKVGSSGKPVPAFDIKKLQAEKEALMKQRAAAAKPQLAGKASGSGRDEGGLGSITAANLHGNPDEEYDPAKPNDYDEFCRRRMRLKAEEEMQRRRQDAVKKAGGAATSEPREDDFATKMMKKMGWKKGEGLGKEGQGISTPLVMQKTGSQQATVVPGSKRPAAAVAGPAAKQQKPVPEVSRPPSKVLMLMNLVGAGEVDEDLEEETADEAGKYGKVVKCVIKETPNVPDDQAVRIFLQFSAVEEATKAFTDMNGRYFGGRVVKARFYDAEVFAKGDYTAN